jgi:N-acetylmuramoyl-L-alanine amidase
MVFRFHTDSASVRPSTEHAGDVSTLDCNMRAPIVTMILALASACHSTLPSQPSPAAIRASAPAQPAADEGMHRLPPPVEAPMCILYLPGAPELSTWTEPQPDDAIVICGRRVRIGTRVVLWTEDPYYDASSQTARFFGSDGRFPDKLGPRFQPGRVQSVRNPDYVPPGVEDELDERTELQKRPTLDRTAVPADSHNSQDLADVVDQFVLHYDVCGLSSTCFRVLQDERMLSVHFMLDIDGTIYQTLDLRDTAWHATKSNARSIGIEIANMGAYPPNRTGPLEDWYRRDTLGTYIQIPSRIKDSGVRTPGFVGRPARGPEPIIGVVQGEDLAQYDFTPEQYASLVKLAAALCEAFPKIAPDAPRDEDGHVIDRALDDEAWRDFHGILGHFHVQANKTDPGPAFDWDTFIPAVQARLAEIRGSKR